LLKSSVVDFAFPSQGVKGVDWSVYDFVNLRYLKMENLPFARDSLKEQLDSMLKCFPTLAKIELISRLEAVPVVKWPLWWENFDFRHNLELVSNNYKAIHESKSTSYKKRKRLMKEITV
jgi:hypothetical protein